MGSGKTMLVSEMAQAVLKEGAPVCIEAFDGSTFGPEDADLQVRSPVLRPSISWRAT